MDPALEAARLVDTLGPEALAKAAAYTAGANRITVAGIFVSALVTWIIVRSGALDRIAVRVNAHRPRLARTAFLAGLVTFLLSALLTLPWSIYTDWWRQQAYGLSSQPLGDFLGQGVLALLISSVLGALFFTGVFVLIRRTGPRWWLWSGGLAAAGLSAFLLLAPAVIEPLFNEYKPLGPGPVRAALEVQADAAGVPRDRIFVFDGSRQSNRFTANVSGIGPSARIAISDVALKGASLDEVRAVTGHEIGHYVLGHVWRSVVLFSALAVLFFFLADRLFPRVARAFGSPARGIGDPVGLPVLLFIIGMLAFLGQPILNAFSRMHETEADHYSFETVNLPDAMATALVKTAEYRDPRPSRLQEVLFYTHPAVEKRVRAAMEWKAAQPPG